MLTWTCHICSEERPDEKISVYKKDISEDHNLPEGTMQQNVRYCNDKLECGQAAKDYNHFSNEKGIDDASDSIKKYKEITMKDYFAWFFIFFAIASIVNTTLSAIFTDVTFYEKLIDPSSLLIRIIVAVWLSVIFTKKIAKKF